MTIQKLNNETKWEMVKAIAAALQMDIFGINKKALVPMLNQKIEDLGDQAEAILSPVFAEFDGSAPTPAAPAANSTTQKSVQTEEEKAQAKAEKEAKKLQQQASNSNTPAEPKGKWYDEAGANPYNSGDKVEIFAGKDLIGRFAMVVKPSSKKDALKARLVNNKDGSLQGCEICLDFSRIRLVAETTAAPVEETEATDQPVDQTSKNESQQVSA